MIKRTVVLLLSVMTICFMASCGNSIEKKVVGSWYDERMNELFLSEDGAYSLEDVGGTYAVDGNRITLTSAMGSSSTYEYIDDEGTPYLLDTGGDWHFYTYEVASELNYEHAENVENQRVSNLDALNEYLVGTWVPEFDDEYIVKINNDHTFTLDDEDGYDTCKGTWELEEGWNNQQYYFIYECDYRGEVKTYKNPNNLIYLGDYRDGDFTHLKLMIINKMCKKEQ